MKLIVIGFAAINQVAGGGFVDGLKEKGNECIVIATDEDYPWRVSGYETEALWNIAGKPTPNYNFHIFSARKSYGGYCKSSEHAKAIMFGWEPIKIIEILDMMKVTEYDAVILIHTSDYIWDLGGINKPIFYYFTGDVNRPRWPRNGIVTGFFAGYSDAFGMFRDIYPIEMHCLKFKMFLPNAYSAKVWYPKRVDVLEDKTHFLGFMGSMSADRGTWFSQQLYKDRQRYIHYLRDKYALELRASQSTEKCREFLQNTFLGVNVSCFGTNMRQFEVPACGALLLQHKNMDCDKTGLVDGENCLMFEDEFELEQKVEWAFANIEAADKIRLEGVKYARKNTFYNRGLEMGEVLNNHLTLFKGSQKETETQPPSTDPMVSQTG